MPTEQLGHREYYRRQARIAHTAAARAARRWSLVDAAAIDASWRRQLPALLADLVAAQAAAAAGAGAVPQVAGQAAVDLRTGAFTGLASDGRGLDSLLELPVRTTLRRIADGLKPAAALRAGQLQLVQIIRSEVADVTRIAGQVAIAATPAVIGYERIVVAPACSRCIVLAGKLYSWNTGFLRHPKCDCQHRAVTREQWEDGEPANTPEQLLGHMTAAQRRKAGLSADDEKALDEGADLGQLVNARRGAAGMAPPGARITREERLLLQNGRERGRVTPVRMYGRDLYVTTEGITSRGLAGQRLGARDVPGPPPAGQRYRRATAPRLLPQSIFAIAGSDRDLAVRLLHRNGYIR